MRLNVYEAREGAIKRRKGCDFEENMPLFLMLAIGDFTMGETMKLFMQSNPGTLEKKGPGSHECGIYVEWNDQHMH